MMSKAMQKAEYLRALKGKWEAYAEQDALWSTWIDPARKGNRWEPADFFATGVAEAAIIMQMVARLAGPDRHLAVDFGCGVGRVTQALARFYQRVVGLDISAAMIDRARSFAPHDLRCEYTVNERADLACLQTGCADLVYSRNVLQHMVPPLMEAYIGEFVRLLKPDGLALFQLAATGPAPPDPGWQAPEPVLDADGYAVMDMYCLAPDRVQAAVDNAGGAILETVSDASVVPHWALAAGWQGQFYAVGRRKA